MVSRRRTFVLITILGTVMAIFVIFPLVWTISLSFTPESAIARWPLQIIPDRPTLRNYSDLLMGGPETQVPIVRWFLNSLLVSGLATTLAVFTTSLAAFAFTRLEFPAKNLLFFAAGLALLLPEQITILPRFLLITKLHWTNTYHALILPWGGNVLGLFLLRQFFLTIPRELDDAAIVDGCGRIRVYWHVILPLSRAPIAAVAIIIFLFSWNDLFWPLIVISSSKMKTVTLGLAGLTGIDWIPWGLTMAATFISFLPVLIFFIFFQSQVVETFIRTGFGGR